MTAARRTPQQFRDLQERVVQGMGPDALVFTRQDLQAWGVDPTSVVPMTRMGLWIRVHHGIYADAGAWEAADPPRRHLLLCQAAQRSLPVPAAAFGPSAALTHGLPMDRSLISEIHLTRSRLHDQRSLRRRVSGGTLLPPIRLHSYAAPDTSTVRGVLTVGLAWAAVSCASLSTREWAVVTMDAAAWADPSGLKDLEDAAGGMPGARGIGVVRQALPLVRTGAQSPLESLSRVRICDLGVEEPELQVALYDASGLIGLVDMLWRRQRVVGEADGRAKYLTRDDLIAEKLREDRLRDLGFRVVRWTWDDIMRRPDDVVHRLRRAMSRRAEDGTDAFQGSRGTA